MFCFCFFFLENSSTTNAGEHIPPGFSTSTILSFKSIENKHDVGSGKDWLKKFCESLKHAMKITDFKKKQMKLLTNKQQKSCENRGTCHACIENLKITMLKLKIS